MCGAVHAAGPKLAADTALGTALRIAAVGAAAVRPMRIRRDADRFTGRWASVPRKERRGFLEVKCRLWEHDNAPGPYTWAVQHAGNKNKTCEMTQIDDPTRHPMGIMGMATSRHGGPRCSSCRA